jgi:hypothetical protein
VGVLRRREVTRREILRLLLQVVANLPDAGRICGILGRYLDRAAILVQPEVMRGLVLIEAHGLGAVLIDVGHVLVVRLGIVLGQAQAAGQKTPP